MSDTQTHTPKDTHHLSFLPIVQAGTLLRAMKQYSDIITPSKEPLQYDLVKRLIKAFEDFTETSPNPIRKEEWNTVFKIHYENIDHTLDGREKGQASGHFDENGHLFAMRDEIFQEAQQYVTQEEQTAEHAAPSLVSLEGQLAQARSELNNQFASFFVPYGCALDHMLEHINGMVLVTGTDSITRKQFEGLAKAAIRQQPEFRDANAEQSPNFENNFLALTNEVYAKALKPTLTVIPSGEPATAVHASQSLER